MDSHRISFPYVNQVGFWIADPFLTRPYGMVTLKHVFQEANKSICRGVEQHEHEGVFLFLIISVPFFFLVKLFILGHYELNC